MAGAAVPWVVVDPVDRAAVGGAAGAEGPVGCATARKQRVAEVEVARSALHGRCAGGPSGHTYF